MKSLIKIIADALVKIKCKCKITCCCNSECSQGADALDERRLSRSVASSKSLNI